MNTAIHSCSNSEGGIQDLDTSFDFSKKNLGVRCKKIGWGNSIRHALSKYRLNIRIQLKLNEILFENY